MSKNLKANSSAPGPTAIAQLKYTPAELIATTDISHYFFPLFFAGERGTLGLWEKHNGLGHVKRRVETDGRKFHVLELMNSSTNIGTFITIPRPEWQALHVTLPHFVMVMRNFRRNFSFEILIMDNKGHRRRFLFATWFNPGNLRKFPFLCHVPLKLESGWNEVHVDLEDLVKLTYKSKYEETLRVQIHANCRVRQMFFCNDQIINNEMPIPSMKMFENMRLLTTEFGPLNHPDYLEMGPDKAREHNIPEPPESRPPTRIERDINILQRERFKELTCNNTWAVQSHYKTYFRNILEEQTHSSKTLLLAKESRVPIEADVVLSEDLVVARDEAPKEREGVPIPLNMKRSMNLMQLINKGKEQKNPSGSNARMEASQVKSQYMAPSSRPPSVSAEREPFYFRPASPLPPPK